MTTGVAGGLFGDEGCVSSGSGAVAGGRLGRVPSSMVPVGAGGEEDESSSEEKSNSERCCWRDALTRETNDCG
jgi:hypothetical protein